VATKLFAELTSSLLVHSYFQVIVEDALVESFVADARPGDQFQFERVGFFTCDPDSTSQRKVFNLTVSLKDSYAKAQK